MLMHSGHSDVSQRKWKIYTKNIRRRFNPILIKENVHELIVDWIEFNFSRLNVFEIHRHIRTDSTKTPKDSHQSEGIRGKLFIGIEGFGITILVWKFRHFERRQIPSSRKTRKMFAEQTLTIGAHRNNNMVIAWGKQ